jgi:hypothetical protein
LFFICCYGYVGGFEWASKNVIDALWLAVSMMVAGASNYSTQAQVATLIRSAMLTLSIVENHFAIIDHSVGGN